MKSNDTTANNNAAQKWNPSDNVRSAIIESWSSVLARGKAGEIRIFLIQYGDIIDIDGPKIAVRVARDTGSVPKIVELSKSFPQINLNDVLDEYVKQMPTDGVCIYPYRAWSLINSAGEDSFEPKKILELADEILDVFKSNPPQQESFIQTLSQTCPNVLTAEVVAELSSEVTL